MLGTATEFFGIPRGNGNHDETAKKLPATKYLKRIRWILKSQLNDKNKIRAINTCALPVIRYAASITIWPKWEIEAVEIKTRKIFTIHDNRPNHG